MQKHSRTRAFGGRLLSASSLVCLALLAAVGCGDDEKGTDIVVPAPSDGGDGGSSTASAGKNGYAGTSSPSEGGDGGANEGGVASNIAGGGGRAGSGNGGNAGASSGGNAGANNAGSGGQAGNGGSAGSPASGGSSGAGAGGMSGGAGQGGMSGSTGTAGAGGSIAGAGGSTAGAGGSNAGSGGGGSAGAAGSGGTGGGTTCGDGSKEGTEECDDSGPSRLCSDDCRTVSTPECVACEQAGDCAFSSDNCLGPEGAPFTPLQVGLCFDVLRCIQDSNCLDGSGSLGKCYCGTLTNPQCSAAPFDLKAAGAPNGPCAGPMQLGAAGVTSNSIMLAGLTTKTRPTGAAGQRLNCQKASEDCKSICGVQ